MAGPWEKYGAPAPAAANGPWSKYAQPSQAFQDATANASAMTLKGKVDELPSRQDNRSVVDKLMDATGATVNGLVNGIPIIGPAAQNVTDAIGGTIAQISTGDFGPILTPEKNANSTAYDDYVNRQRAVRGGYAERAPLASLSGNVVSALGSYGGLAKIPGMATTLGLEAAAGAKGVGALLWQATRAAASNQLIGTVDSMVRGDSPADAFNNNLIGSGVSFGLPIAGAGIRAAGRFVNDRFIRPVATMLNTDNAATGVLSRVIGADKRTGSIMSAADEAVANDAGVPLINADRFGRATRKLARTASNIDDESSALFSRTVEDRFAGQTDRAENYVKQLMGGATDDLMLKDRLRAAADKANGINYAKAFNDPKAAKVWSKPISELMESPTFRKVVDAAEERSADRAAISGFKAVKNPFVETAGGGYTLRTNADGSRAFPTLQFWDQVKRNIDELIENVRPTATEKGNRTLFGDYTTMKRKLVDSLDAQVDSYKQTRSTAAEFFGADDAIDVGRKAFASAKNMPEQSRVHAAMSKADKDAAAVGYASELIDNIRVNGDNRNVAIANFFNSPAARARNKLYLGETRARQLEAYVRVEAAVDMLRGAVKGGSNTTEQLIAAGAVGTGVTAMTGDWQQGLTAGAVVGIGMRALKFAGKNADEQVMRKVAEALLSNDPKVLERAINNASLSQKHMDAIDAIMTGLQTTARGVMSGTAASGPVDLGVIAGGNPALAGSGL
jgi:hypothetical protein